MSKTDLIKYARRNMEIKLNYFSTGLNGSIGVQSTQCLPESMRITRVNRATFKKISGDVKEIYNGLFPLN